MTRYVVNFDEMGACTITPHRTEIEGLCVGVPEMTAEQKATLSKLAGLLCEVSVSDRVAGRFDAYQEILAAKDLEIAALKQASQIERVEALERRAAQNMNEDD
jgi:hypothetical protein